jgi:hypothetical protein
VTSEIEKSTQEALSSKWGYEEQKIQMKDNYN